MKINDGSAGFYAAVIIMEIFLLYIYFFVYKRHGKNKRKK